jgi:peptide/nickel transport system permease protein
MTTLDTAAIVAAGEPDVPPAPMIRPVGSRRSRWRLGLSLTPLAIVVIFTVIGPWITPYDPEMVVGSASAAPSGKHWFGTDSSSLDVLSQTLAAARTNVTIAALVMVFATVAGAVLGLVSGMNEAHGGPRGLGARALTRVTDFVQAVPAMLVGLVAVAFYGASVTTLVVALSIILSPLQARLVRTEVLRVRTDAYVDAARMAGLSEIRLTIKHVLPNSCRPALENASVLFALSIILTASLGFLGAGLPPPQPEWGSGIARGATDAAVGRWWPATFPTLALLFTVAAVATASSAIFRRRDS